MENYINTKNAIDREAVVYGFEYANKQNFASGHPDRLTIAHAFADGYKFRATEEPDPTDTTERKPVSIVEIDGEKFVQVHTVDERFAIALHDIDHEMTWEEAMEYDLPTKKQASIICVYLDEINAALVEAGGDKLDKWYWTSSEYNAYGSWFYYGGNGRLYGSSRNGTCSVRPVLSL